MLFLIFLTALKPALAEESDVEVITVKEVNRQRLTIADPFIEMRTGAGQAYPITYVVDRGAEIFLLRRRTDWFQVRTLDGRTGWASRQQMLQTLLPNGENFVVNELTEEDFPKRKWVIGFSGGEFESAPVFSLFSARSLTPNLSVEGTLGNSVGSVSSSSFWKANLVMQPLPELTYSPYFTLGFGKIKVSPSATLIVPVDQNNVFSQVGIGLQRHVSRSFMLRFETNEYVVFSSSTSNPKNEVVHEWKIGFAVFF